MTSNIKNWMNKNKYIFNEIKDVGTIILSLLCVGIFVYLLKTVPVSLVR